MSLFYIQKDLILKMGNCKKELRNFNTQWSKRSYRFSHNIFLSIPKKQSKRIIETESTRWLQSKDPLKSEWIRHFNEWFSMEYWQESIK